MTRKTFQSTQFRDPYCKSTTNAPPIYPIELTICVYRIRELTSFRTQHELHPSEGSVDSYTFHVFGFAIDPSTNLPIDMARFAIADSVDGYAISSRAMNITKDFTYNTDSGLTTAEILAHALEVGIGRSKFTQALTMCMFVTTWFLTIVSTYFAFSAVKKGTVDFAIVVLHASIVLAIAGIQKIYTSPPPFGISLGTIRLYPPVARSNGVPLDTWGSFSQAAIVAFCSMMLLFTATKSYLSTKAPSKSREKV